MSYRHPLAVALVTFAAVACAGLDTVPPDAEGVWSARRPGGGDQVRLDLFRGPVGHRDTDRTRLWFDVGELDGLTAEAFKSGPEPLQFRLVRDAGTLVFDGSRQRRPKGSFAFEPSDAFLGQLERLGIESPNPTVLLELAIFGVSAELVESLAAAGLVDDDASGLLSLHRHGLDAEWIASIVRLEQATTFDRILTLRRYGVDRRDVDKWIKAGIDDRSIDEFVRVAQYGLDVENIATYRELGFEAFDEWLSFERNGVRPEFVQAMLQADVEGTDLDDIVMLDRHGVDVEDVTGATSLITAGFDWDDLLYIWRRGVQNDDVSQLLAAGWTDLDADDVVTLRTHGIDTDWALTVRAAGGETLDISDYVKLRQHGVSAANYERYAALGYVDANDVRAFAQSGVEPVWLEGVLEYLSEQPRADELTQMRRAGVSTNMLADLREAGQEGLNPDDLVTVARRGVDHWVQRGLAK